MIEVAGQRQSGGRGRPTHLYSLTQQARAHNLDQLAGALLDELLEDLQPTERLAALKRIAKRLGGQSTAARQPDATPECLCNEIKWIELPGALGSAFFGSPAGACPLPLRRDLAPTPRAVPARRQPAGGYAGRLCHSNCQTGSQPAGRQSVHIYDWYGIMVKAACITWGTQHVS